MEHLWLPFFHLAFNQTSCEGWSIMKMDEGLDTGEVLVEKQIKIANEENLKTLSRKLSNLSSELFLKAISEIEKNKKGDINHLLVKQKEFKRELKYARMITKSDYIINWDDTSINIYRKVNALYPRANTTFKKKNLKIIKIKILAIDEIHNNHYNFLSSIFIIYNCGEKKPLTQYIHTNVPVGTKPFNF